MVRSQLTHDQYKVEQYDDLKRCVVSWCLATLMWSSRQLDITSQQVNSTSEHNTELEMAISDLQKDKDQLTASVSINTIEVTNVSCGVNLEK